MRPWSVIVLAALCLGARHLRAQGGAPVGLTLRWDGMVQVPVRVARLAGAAPWDTIPPDTAPYPAERREHLGRLATDLEGASRYAGVGAVAGGVLGLVYGTATERPSTFRGVAIIADGLVGAVIGLVGGSVFYVVRRTTGHVHP